MINVICLGAAKFGWSHEEMVWEIPLKAQLLYIREKARLDSDKVCWTLQDKEMIDNMEQRKKEDANPA